MTDPILSPPPIPPIHNRSESSSIGGATPDNRLATAPNIVRQLSGVAALVGRQNSNLSAGQSSIGRNQVGGWVGLWATEGDMHAYLDVCVISALPAHRPQHNTHPHLSRHIQGTFGRNSAVQGTWGRNSAVSGIAGIRPSVFGHLAAEEPPRQITGNPSDKAVFTFCNLFKDIEETRREWPQLYIMCV